MSDWESKDKIAGMVQQISNMLKGDRGGIEERNKEMGQHRITIREWIERKIFA